MNESHPMFANETLEFDDNDSFEVDQEKYDAYYETLLAAIDDTPEFTSLWDYFFDGSSDGWSSTTSSTEDLEQNDNGYRAPRKRKRSESPPPAPPPKRRKSRPETIVLDD